MPVQLSSTGDGHFSVVGDLTFATAERAFKFSGELISGGKSVVVNLEQVERVDSAGLACLLEWVRQANHRKVSISFETINRQLTELIRVSGLEKVLPIAA